MCSMKFSVWLLPGCEPVCGRLHAEAPRDEGAADAVPRQPRSRLLPRKAHVQPSGEISIRNAMFYWATGLNVAQETEGN